MLHTNSVRILPVLLQLRHGLLHPAGRMYVTLIFYTDCPSSFTQSFSHFSINAGKPDREGREVSVSMDELVEEGREETAGLTRQEYMNSLDIKGVSSYISHFLSEEILRCPALIEKWLKDCVNEEGQSV